MKQTGHKWLEQLPKHIQEQLKANVIAQHKSLDKLNKEFNNLHEFITGVMTWSTTYEDVKGPASYWSSLYYLCESSLINKTPLNFTSLYEQYPQHSKREEVNNTYSIF